MLVQARNPITDRWIKIDTFTASIVAHKKSPGPYKGVRIMQKMTEAITKLLREEQKKLGSRSDVELLFTLSSKAYRQLNKECDCIRLGTRPCEINEFCSEFGKTRIVEGKDQSDDILTYRKFK